MAKIVGIEGLTTVEVMTEVELGARFVAFQYCISVFIMSFRRSSDVYFIRAGESTLARSLGFTVVSLLFGWWGIPWGPIFTIQSLFINLRGGRDLTPSVVESVTSGEPA